MEAIELPNGTNQAVESCLREVADLLESHGANPFRVQAYRKAADTIHVLTIPVSALLAEHGTAGLRDLPGIGQSLAGSIANLLETGRMPILSRLRGEMSPEHVLTSVPGIGPELAKRIHDELGIESLGELEVAAIDGRLSRVGGMGRRRVQAVRESLAGRFRRRQSPPRHQDQYDEPPVDELLDVDRDYRQQAKGGHLPRITPRRFNPTQEAWLPVLHTTRGDRHYSVLFSNTARAHEFGMTHDWVVIYRDDHGGEGQWTVITSRLGELQGRRIVRGREAACKQYYGDRKEPLL